MQISQLIYNFMVSYWAEWYLNIFNTLLFSLKSVTSWLIALRSYYSLYLLAWCGDLYEYSKFKVFHFSYIIKHMKEKNVINVIYVRTLQYLLVTWSHICSSTQIKNHISVINVISHFDRSNCLRGTKTYTTILIMCPHHPEKRHTNVQSVPGRLGTRATSYVTWLSTILTLAYRKNSWH